LFWWGNPEGKKPFDVPTSRRTWEDNIKMDFLKKQYEDVDWIHLTQDGDKWRAVVNMVMNFHVP
jgi:hypothetical protein